MTIDALPSTADFVEKADEAEKLGKATLGMDSAVRTMLEPNSTAATYATVKSAIEQLKVTLPAAIMELLDTKAGVAPVGAKPKTKTAQSSSSADSNAESGTVAMGECRPI